MGKLQLTTDVDFGSDVKSVTSLSLLLLLFHSEAYGDVNFALGESWKLILP